MTMLRLALALVALSALATSPSTGAAQEPAAAIISRPLTLETARLSCPECACARARNDALMLRREYRDVHRKVSTRSPRILMTAGLAGAGGVLVASYLASVFVPLAATAPGGGWSLAEGRRFERRVMVAGTIISLGALGVGLFGASKVAERKRDGEPYRERDAQLHSELSEARRAERQQCRGIR